MVISQSLFLGPAHFLGLLATTLDRFDEACEHFAAAADAQERSGAAATLVHTQLEWARAVLFAHELGLSGLHPRIAALAEEASG